MGGGGGTIVASESELTYAAERQLQAFAEWVKCESSGPFIWGEPERASHLWIKRKIVWSRQGNLIIVNVEVIKVGFLHRRMCRYITN